MRALIGFAILALIYAFAAHAQQAELECKPVIQPVVHCENREGSVDPFGKQPAICHRA